MNHNSEKRGSLRKFFKAPVAIEEIQFGEVELARMINYDQNGLYLESDRIIRPGTEIIIEIGNSPYTTRHTDESYHAKVIWGRRLKDSIYSFGYGVRFINAPSGKNGEEKKIEGSADFRRYPRRDVNKYTFIRSQNNLSKGCIRNVSRGGCFIETKEIFNFNQIIGLVIPDVHKGANIRLSAKIVRLSPTGIGVKFKRLSERKVKENSRISTHLNN